MSRGNPVSGNGKSRRTGADRRKKDRRDPDRAQQTGVLSTRTGERRRTTRRAADKAKKKA